MLVTEYIKAQHNKCTHLNDTLSVMNQDKAAALIRNDELIMKFGSSLYFKHGHNRHRWQYLSERLRQIGRLLNEIRKQGHSVRSLTDCISAEKFSAA